MYLWVLDSEVSGSVYNIICYRHRYLKCRILCAVNNGYVVRDSPISSV